MDWSAYYPAFVDPSNRDDATQIKAMRKDVEVVDIGCGFGGLLVALAPILSDKLLLGQLENSTIFSMNLARRRVLLTIDYRAGN